MARIDLFSTMVVLFLACGAVSVAPGLALEWSIVPSESIGPMGEYDDIPPLNASEPTFEVDVPDAYTLPPEPQPGFYKYLESCAIILTEKCGEEIFDKMFENTTMNEDCCYKLVQMGKPCHDELSKMMASLPEYKANAPEIPKKSLEVWNQCVSVASPSS
ncbi:hypothetical protein HHK36_000468 [Tetracentron sinense]|uniref:Prolamin-like domain-containing protein n=1 Tax=Tetracentron sinense TaxID=13715 RepID=A0A835DR27_TETSI|nr:hypothetical protein HHK36_000468 [Tetracentron sinense]